MHIWIRATDATLCGIPGAHRVPSRLPVAWIKHPELENWCPDCEAKAPMLLLGSTEL